VNLKLIINKDKKKLTFQLKLNRLQIKDKFIKLFKLALHLPKKNFNVQNKRNFLFSIFFKKNILFKSEAICLSNI